MGTLLNLLLIMLIPTIMGQDFIFPDDEMFKQPSAPILPPLALGAVPSIRRPTQPIPSKSPVNQLNSNGLSDGINTLGLQINNELHIGQERSYTQDRPVIFSPLNIAEAIYMLLLGANGQTYNELSKFLGITDLNNSQRWHDQFGQVLQSFEDPNPDSPKLTAATGLFVQEGYPIRNEYRDIVKRIYKSDINNLNFIRYPEQAKNYINNWVNTRTNGKIQQILTESPPVTTKVILTTALYFKGAWEQPFIQEATQKRPFYPYGRKNKTSVLVDMMANFGQFRYIKDKELNCEMIELPYKGGTTSMHVIVPMNSDREKLRTLEKRLTPDIINRLIEQSNISDSLIVFPKMRIESTIELSSILSDLGIQTLFDPSLSNLGVLSPGPRNEIPKNEGTLLANRFGDEIKTNCSHFFEQNNILPNCIDQLPQPVNNYTKVIYKRFGSTIGRRFARHYIRREHSFSSVHRISKRQTGRSIDDVRNSVNQKSVNPGLYADEVLHKVYIDINESGTEAAAATDVTITKSLIRTVRLDHPFLFFIRHHASKMILFWGSINTPIPNYPVEK